MSQILSFRGRNALSGFRIAKLTAALAAAGLRPASIAAEYHHFASVTRALSTAERGTLEHYFAVGLQSHRHRPPVRAGRDRTH